MGSLLVSIIGLIFRLLYQVNPRISSDRHSVLSNHTIKHYVVQFHQPVHDICVFVGLDVIAPHGEPLILPLALFIVIVARE